jgi:hypothetical protein
MTNPIVVHSLSTRGCTSETGRLRKVLMCPPTYFRIDSPINVVQWLYSHDGLPRHGPWVMVQQRGFDLTKTEGNARCDTSTIRRDG